MPTSNPFRRKKGIHHVFLTIALAVTLPSSISVEASGNGCDRYVKCRADLLEIHWKCAEQSRKLTQHACKMNNLYGNHKTTSYNIESIFGACTERYSAISDIDYLLETDPSCLPPEDQEVTFSEPHCWSDLMRLTQKCYSLSRCCPAANRCNSEVLHHAVNEQYELEKRKMKVLLEECAVEMDMFLNATIHDDDLAIAKRVGKATRELLNSVVPFRIFPDTRRNFHKIVNANRKPKEFAAPALKLSAFKLSRKGESQENIVKTTGRKPIRHRYGISRPKVLGRNLRTRNEVTEPPTSSLRPFTALHTGDSLQTSSQPPAFSPFSFQTLDFESQSPRKLRKGKKRRNRKRKHNLDSRPYLQHASKISKIPRFGSHLGAKKLDRLAGNVKEKGEYGRNFVPKMLLVKQNEGKFLGYAQPFIQSVGKIGKPTIFSQNVDNNKNTNIDQIYDDIIESQIFSQNIELSNSLHTSDLANVKNTPTRTFEMEKVQVTTESNSPVTFDLHSNEAFINNNGAWTMDPPNEAPTTSTLPSEPNYTSASRLTVPTTVSSTHETSKSFSTLPEFKTEPTIKPETSTQSSTILTTPTNSITNSSTNPLEDYITHELLDRHMEKDKEDDDFDFSSADYIDISAMDISPSSGSASSSSSSVARYEPNSFTTTWPSATSQTTIPELRTTSIPLNAAELSNAQTNDDLVPFPSAAVTFGAEDITPSPWTTTTPLYNQLWPIPIRKLRRLKAMGAKIIENQIPIVLVPMGRRKQSFKKIEGFKQKFFTGCSKLASCLRKDSEIRMKCSKPYPTPLDQCSSQLLPLYKLIDEASDRKLRFFIDCISGAKEKSHEVLLEKPMKESSVNCDNIDEWSNYCRKLENYCSANDKCNADAEIDHVGTRLRLLEKSFSLRAAACQFKHDFHKSIVTKN